MKYWNTKEAQVLLEWARQVADERTPIEEIAAHLGRSVRSVQEFLRRTLPQGQRPWNEKPRWSAQEIQALERGGEPCSTRSRVAVRQYLSRHRRVESDDLESEHVPLTVTQVAADLGLSRASVYRLLKRGALRRFKGGIAETSFSDLLKEHPEAVPYSRLSRDQREWLVLNGYADPSLQVKRPSVRGILD